MKKIYFFLIVLSMSITEQSHAQCPAGSKAITGDNLNLEAGNWCLSSGSFTGNVSSISSGATIYIANGASFKPQNLNGGLNGTFQVYGECSVSNASMKANFRLFVYGKVNFGGATIDGANVEISNSGELNFNNNINFNGGSSSIIRNNVGGVLNFNQTTSLGANTIVDNSGTFKVAGDFSLNESSSTFYNRNNAVSRVSNNFNPKGKVSNDGLLVVSNFTNVNSATNMVNNCRFVSVNGMNNNSPSYFTNNGLIWTPRGKVQNNSGATLDLGSRSITRGVDFGNDGMVKGSGKMHFTGSTTQQGSFNGTGFTSPIIFFDASRSGTRMFDYPEQNQVYSYTVRSDFSPADTSNFDCSGMVLPVQLTGFDAQAVQNKTVLISWQSRSEVNLKKFVVERSLTANNTNWELAGSVNATGISATTRSYQLTDSKPFGGTSFYRLRSVDVDGKETISAVRQVNMDSKENSLQVYPTLVQKGGLVKVITTEQVQYQLLDISGKTIRTGKLVSGANTLLLNVNTGNYIIETLSPNNVRQHAKLIVQ